MGHHLALISYLLCVRSVVTLFNQSYCFCLLRLCCYSIFFRAAVFYAIHNATTGQPTETPRPTMYTRRTQPHDTITYKLYVPWYYSTCLPVFCARSCCTAAAIFQRDTICILLPVFFCDTLLRCCRDLSTAMYRLYPLHLFFVRMSCCTAGAIFQRLYTDCIIFTCFLCDILLHCRDLPTSIYRLYLLTCFLCACLVALLPRSFNGYIPTVSYSPVFCAHVLLHCWRDLSTAIYRLYHLHLFFVRYLVALPRSSNGYIPTVSSYLFSVRMPCCTAAAIFQRIFCGRFPTNSSRTERTGSRATPPPPRRYVHCDGCSHVGC